jgi:hypothetical protein
MGLVIDEHARKHYANERLAATYQQALDVECRRCFPHFMVKLRAGALYPSLQFQLR